MDFFLFPYTFFYILHISNVNLEIIIFKLKVIKTSSHEIFIELLYAWS